MAGVDSIGTSSVIFTLLHIFTGIKEPGAGERASSGSVLLYKKHQCPGLDTHCYTGSRGPKA